MDNMRHINTILQREQVAKDIIDILTMFDKKCKDNTFKKGIYIYGSPGCGKSFFINSILRELDYDVIQYDAGDVRNKSLIDTITSNNMASQNVLQLMSKKVKKIAIIRKQDLIQRVDAENVHNNFESSFTKHLRFGMSLL
jgi:predicted ATPase